MGPARILLWDQHGVFLCGTNICDVYVKLAQDVGPTKGIFFCGTSRWDFYVSSTGDFYVGPSEEIFMWDHHRRFSCETSIGDFRVGPMQWIFVSPAQGIFKWDQHKRLMWDQQK